MGEIKCDVLQKEYREFKVLTEECKKTLLQRGLRSTEYRAIRQQFDQKREHLQGLINERKEFFTRLQDLYFTSKKYDTDTREHTYDPEIQEILDHPDTDKKEALAYIFNCRPDQIASTEEEALSGDIVFYDGGILMHDLTKWPQDITLPKHVGGSIALNSITEWPQGVTMPKHVGGNLYLNKELRGHPSVASIPKGIAIRWV